MPAPSKAMRQAAAIAEHHPEKLHEENKGMLDMSKEQLHDFAATKEKHLPEHKHGRGMHKDEKHHGGRMKHPRGG